MKKEIFLRTEGYGEGCPKIFLEVMNDNTVITAAMLEDTNNDGVIDIVRHVGDIDGDSERDNDDEKLLRDIGNLFLKIKL